MASRKRFRVRPLPPGGRLADYWVYRPLSPKKLRMLTNFIKHNGVMLPMWVWLGGFAKTWGMPIGGDATRIIRVGSV